MVPDFCSCRNKLTTKTHTLVGKPENELLGEINTEKELAKLPPNAGQPTLCTILSRRILLYN